VYLGVGPEQNFSYIAAIRPRMAFICDIRRQAVMQHLMFKAIFEFSKDRADFLSLLFAKPKPAGIDPAAPIQGLWQAFFGVNTDLTLAARTRSRVIDHLTKTHKFALTEDERLQLDSVLSAFVQFGPGITTRGSYARRARRRRNTVTFADLTGWSFDASNSPQSFCRPVDFQCEGVARPEPDRARRGISADQGAARDKAYLTGTADSAFTSNVEQYLFQDSRPRRSTTTLPPCRPRASSSVRALRRGAQIRSVESGDSSRASGRPCIPTTTRRPAWASRAAVWR
jgi:hypothetical protein